ncbi:MAG: OmpA family protein [Bacteroidales bacterium]|nr:OmpA family protein [Bacteroidales bacterium]
MNKRTIIIYFILGFFLAQTVNSQQLLKIKKSEFKIEGKSGIKEAWAAVKSGNQYFSEGLGTYREARENYLAAYSYNAENAELNYMLGVCYLNIDAKFESINYFRKAYELDAEVSPDIHYMLGRAYHLVLDFDNAITEYKEYKEHIHPKQITILGPRIDNLIEQCHNGKDLVANPRRVVINNLGREINSVYDEYNPVVSADESVMYFTTRRPYSEKSKRNPFDNKFFEDIYYTDNVDGNWIRARRMEKSINQKKNKMNNAVVGLSPDKLSLYSYIGNKNEGDLFVSNYKKGKWTSPKALSGKINSNSRETSLCISSDESLLFFVSTNDKNNYGGSDIYYCKKNDRGRWSKPANLGAMVNTSYDEAAVSLSANDSILFFSSKGHNTMGGFDIFQSTMSDVGLWSKPVNVGYPINTPDDDVFYKLMPDKKSAYYSTIRETGIGGRDIYKVIFLGAEKGMLISNDSITVAAIEMPVEGIFFEPPLKLKIDTSILMKGLITDTENNSPVKAKIELIDPDFSNSVATAISDSSGRYQLRIPVSKSYGVEIVAKGYLLLLDAIDVSGYTFDEVIFKDFSLERVEVGAKVILKNIFFEFGKSALKPESYSELDNVVKLLESNESIRIEISGHTDNVGSLKANTKLSQDRAKAVSTYLVGKGINSSRLEYKGYADTQPVATNNTADGRAQNRRVEFKILSK